MENFVTLCTHRQLTKEEMHNLFDDCVDMWHGLDSSNVEIYEFLGLSFEDYSVIATRPSQIVSVIDKYRKNER